MVIFFKLVVSLISEHSKIKVKDQENPRYFAKLRKKSADCRQNGSGYPILLQCSQSIYIQSDLTDFGCPS